MHLRLIVAFACSASVASAAAPEAFPKLPVARVVRVDVEKWLKASATLPEWSAADDKAARDAWTRAQHAVAKRVETRGRDVKADLLLSRGYGYDKRLDPAAVDGDSPIPAKFVGPCHLLRVDIQKVMTSTAFGRRGLEIAEGRRKAARAQLAKEGAKEVARREARVMRDETERVLVKVESWAKQAAALGDAAVCAIDVDTPPLLELTPGTIASAPDVTTAALAGLDRYATETSARIQAAGKAERERAASEGE